MTGASGEPAYIRGACEASLRRLQTDYIDLYQFHLGDYSVTGADGVIETLELLVAEGKIRWYGWSTDDSERAGVFAQGEHCAAIQQRFNIFEGEESTLRVCERQGLASVNRGPLAMGLLAGKFDKSSTLPCNDVRHSWDLGTGEQARRLDKLTMIQKVLTEGGRTLAQGALGWLWAKSEMTIPIPGFKTRGQVEENAGALRFGPLADSQMAEIADLMIG